MWAKKSNNYFFLLFVLLLVLPLQVRAGRKVVVYTVNYPLTYFAERIGGEYVNVVFPAPPNIDPAFWVPGRETVKQFQQADLIILNGAGYEKWTNKVSLPMLRTVDTSRSFKDNLIHIETTVTHSHGPGGDHSHGGTAFTTWLDFSQAALQAETIYKALAHRIPDLKTEFARNFQSLEQELLDLDKQMLALNANKPAIPLFGSHHIYQYLARRYKLSLKMVMWEPDANPEAKEWQNLQELLKEHPANWMIWEGEPLTESVQHLKEIGVKSQVFSPCFAIPKTGDFLSVMQQNVDNMRLILK